MHRPQQVYTLIDTPCTLWSLSLPRMAFIGLPMSHYQKNTLVSSGPFNAIAPLAATEPCTLATVRAPQGDEPIRVEVRSSEQGVFGRGNKKDTTFGKLVAAMASGDTSLYLTTQDVAAAADGFPELHAGPVSRLSTDFPARPALLGGLVPQNINLWMGCAPDGASSGLHHDFHDNLYILLRGRKRFRLYSPELVSRMYTHGTPRTVHPNGRIVYAGDGDVRADGVSTGPAAAVPHLHPFTLTALHHTHHD